MLVYGLGEEEKVNNYLAPFNVHVSEDVLYGKINERTIYAELIKDGPYLDKEEENCAKLINAMLETDLTYAFISLYIGNLPATIKMAFRKTNLEINEHDIIIIKDDSFKGYSNLVDIQHRNSFIKPFMNVLLYHWRDAITYKHSHFDVSFKIKANVSGSSYKYTVYKNNEIEFHTDTRPTADNIMELWSKSFKYKFTKKIKEWLC